MKFYIREIDGKSYLISEPFDGPAEVDHASRQEFTYIETDDDRGDYFVPKVR